MSDIQLPLALGDLLLWIIIMIVWGGAQVFQRNQEAKKVEERRRRLKEKGNLQDNGEAEREKPVSAPSPIDAGLREFLEQLTGQPPVRTAPPPPVPVPVREPKIEFDAPYTPPPPPVLEAEAPLAITHSDYSIEELDTSQVYEQGGEITDWLEDGYVSAEISHALIDMSSVMVDLTALRYSPPRIPTPLNRIAAGRTSKPNLRSSETLKRAVIASVLLSPPKALEPELGLGGSTSEPR